ncbi:facilitated trehalose transporter Tret1-like isoform X2 [Belonocnema kinseyi]|uniref:facilitated trehalose transporter Tret1-like isoform X2 n=1 Tax=Belonocnema kinseyi TaxID=2817044 RepID=UPI00143E0BCE|nr:facilitated trehalose transporter Tret1-like isoform X2 [Belonocnema kinseyi]
MDYFKLNSERKKRAESKRIVKSDNLKNNEESGAIGRSFLPQFIACIGAIIINIDVAVIMVWTSPALPYLKSNQTGFPVSDSQGAWIAALPSLSAIIGGLIFPLFINKIGRRYTMLIFGTLHALGAVLIILAKSYIDLYVARIICGIGSGGGYSTTIVYFGEIANKEIRETPHFYLMKGKDAKAVKTLMKLRGVKDAEDVMADIQIIKKSILENEVSEKPVWREMFCKNGCRKSILVVVLAKAASVFSGSMAISAYAQEILTESGSTLAPTSAAMIFTGMNIIAILPTTQFIDRFRRRPLFLVSGILSGICIGSVGLFFFLKLYLKYDLSSIAWLPLAGLIMFEFSFYMGFAILPMVFLSELFPLRVKGAAIGFANALHAVFGFTLKLTYQYLKSAGGIYIPFLTFSACCICGACSVFWVAPETKCKSLEEIQDMLKTKKSKPVSLILDSVTD